MYQRILVPHDGSPTSYQALDAAIGLAKLSGGSIRLVHVVEETAYMTGYDQFGGYSGALISAMREGGQKILDDAMAHVRRAGVHVDSMLFDQFGHRLGDAVAKAAETQGADLVVVGTHGRRGLGRLLLGSGAEDIVRHGKVPVLVVRGQDEAPVSS